MEKKKRERKEEKKRENRLNAEHDAGNGVTLPRSNDRESRV